MNTVPGLTTRFKFIPDVTTKEMRKNKNDSKFNFILLCNKICGGAHYKMKMIVVVLPEAEYKAWIKAKEKQTFKDMYFATAAAPVSPVATADTLNVAMDAMAAPAN
jgi:cytochrome c oxidase subunit 2